MPLVPFHPLASRNLQLGSLLISLLPPCSRECPFKGVILPSHAPGSGPW